MTVSAEGLRSFGRTQEAKRAAERLLEVASRHTLHEYAIRAESILDEVERPSAPTQGSRAMAAPNAHVANIARLIAEMRAAAGLPA